MAEESTGPRLTEADILALLRRKYCAPEWFFLPHVRNGSGFTAVPRTMDALAISLWPSRGLDMLGFEVKTYRADWLRELRDPAKAEAFNDFVDYWWVVSQPGIILFNEVPRTWGFLEVSPSKKLRVKKLPVADRNRGGKLNFPAGFHRGFLAAILQRFEGRFVPKEQIEVKLQAARDQGRSEGLDQMKFKEQDFDDLKKMVKEFEQASGITIDRYDDVKTVKLGRLLRTFLEKGPEHFKQAAENRRASLVREMAEIDRYLESFTTITSHL